MQVGVNLLCLTRFVEAEHLDWIARIAELGYDGVEVPVLHVSENDRGIPGRGQIDFAPIFAAARRNGFDGWVTLEAFGSGLPELAAATRVWRPLFPDFDTLFAESVAFIRQTWGLL